MVARQRLTEPTQVATERRLQRVERAAPIGFSSITRGGLRVQSADGIQVHTVPGGLPGLRVTGLQVVDGVLRITGTLEGGGTFSWTGTINQLGPTNLRGPVAITGENGTLTVDAETLLRGLTRLLADLQVEEGGEIVVQGSSPIRLRQVGGGAVIEVGGSTIREQDGMLAIDAGGGSGIFQDGFGVQLRGGSGGDVRFVASSFGPQIVGLPTITAALSGLPAGAVHVNSTGQLFRVID